MAALFEPDDTLLAAFLDRGEERTAEARNQLAQMVPMPLNGLIEPMPSPACWPD